MPLLAFSSCKLQAVSNGKTWRGKKAFLFYGGEEECRYYFFIFVFIFLAIIPTTGRFYSVKS